MEAFEHLVKVSLEAQHYVVTTNIKFPVKRLTKNGQWQKHGYEVDIVAAKHNSLILGSVKSFLGSVGVSRQGFEGIAIPKPGKNNDFGGYKLFNDADLRREVFKKAEEYYGYPENQIQLKLYVGKFKKGDENAIREHLGNLIEGAGPIEVVGLEEIVNDVRETAESSTYLNDPVLVTVKSLKQAGHLETELKPVDPGEDVAR